MQVLDDVRYALRQFAKAPGFTITAILTLALGIGATTAIFTLVHAVLLKSLPVVNPDELYRVGNEENCCVNGGMQDNWTLFSYEQYKQFRDNNSGFATLAGFQSGQTLIGVRRNGSNKPAESFKSEYVSGNYFSTFGIGPYIGRTLTMNDDTKGAPPAAMMSFRTWQEKFGKDPSVVGAGFVINGQPFTIVGITPPGFFGDRVQSNPPGFFLPLNVEPLVAPTSSILEDASLDWLDLIGRIKTGANTSSMEAQMQVQLKQFLLSPLSKVEDRDKPLVAKQTLHFSHGGNGVQMMRDEYKDGLHLLMWVSAFVLLIACANLANLMLVRATTRQQQTSVRSALGAPRFRLVRQALTESIVLAVLGGTAGIALAFAGTKIILRLAFRNDYVPIQASPSLPVLAFALGVAILTGVLFGVAPAWITAKANPVEALRGANRSTGRDGGWGQKSLVVIQAALSLVLLCAAGLLTRSLSNLQHQNFGFDTANRYILHIDPQMAGYKPSQLEALYRQLNGNLSAIVGVKQVSFSLYTPMEGDNWGEGVYIDGEAPPPPGTPDHGASWVRVSPHYFETIGTKIVEGRANNEQDTATTRNIAVVNRFFEQKYFKDGHAIGKHFSNDIKNPGWFEIVGVTEDTRYQGPTSKMRPMYFLAQGQSVHSSEPRYQQFEDRSQYLNAIAIQTAGPVPNLEAQVRRALAQVNPDLALIDFNTFAEQVKGNFTQQVMIAKLTSFFGILALVLASIGLYGVTAYSVERRTSEIGIRMALGADRMNVLRLVLRSAFLQVGIGLVIGIPVTIFGGRIMASQLFGVKSYDPLILCVTIIVLAAAAFVAALVPARRAAGLEPMRALRME
ncbi:ABC efflux pump, inner membrane subunit [Acidisarcina polymorpha]|uniref:ABC efflux pump, inner membrane subunit n=1 Tax=Acidisarcina polymorpha TaxID=2211140 RepID=A0A2Z5FX24_9BACT|nr:ABC transporter permease [Acidisarcina polymorpha]AXC11047.1 ABC efflux pump, inner membrane subunit [Acidisarcina polymorpha]